MADIDLAELLGGDDVDLDSLFAEAASDTDDDDAGVADEGGGEDQPGDDRRPAASGQPRDEQGRFAKSESDGDVGDGEAGESEGDEPDDLDGEGEAVPGDAPDAEAEAAFERRYQERFAEESRKATQEAVSKLQSSLDKRHAALLHEKEDIAAEAAVHAEVLSRALATLAEFDEDAAKALRAHGSIRLNEARSKRQADRTAQQASAQERESWYATWNATPGNPHIDPNDPVLLDAFRTRNRDAYEQRFAYLKLLGEQQAAKPAAPPVEAKPPAATPAKVKAEATRQREKARGKQPLADGRAPAAKLETLDDSDRLVQKLAKRMNISY